MIVRCGRCQVELEVAGPGEFLCPACGTRNAVRGRQGAGPLDVPDLGAPSPFSTPAPPPAPDEPAPGVRWAHCPACRYRFALGTVDRVSCPSCAVTLSVSDDGLEEVES